MDFATIKEYAYNAALALGALAVIYLVLYLIDVYTKRLKSQLLKLQLRSLKLFGIEIMNVGKQELMITSTINGLQIFVSISVLYFTLVLILGEIPATENIAIELINLIFEPLKTLFMGFIGYLPELFNIAITVIIARYLIKVVKYISNGVRSNSFHFPGFHPNTARTTGGIITFLIYVLTIIIILPSMPGYESLAFKGIATFLGALITIGGSSVIANYMAGIVLTYMHAFERGDWVTIGETSGKVLGTGAFAVRLHSYKGEAISIPNSKVLSADIRNYSGKNKKQMILHTEVSIGYDVSWKKVRDLLVEAAKRTPLLEKDKEPFVLQKKLDDFYVVYELNTFLSQPEAKPRTQSSLHANILDVFEEAHIEIMSPHYRAQRDGTDVTLPSSKKETTDEKQSN